MFSFTVKSLKEALSLIALSESKLRLVHVTSRRNISIDRCHNCVTASALKSKKQRGPGHQEQHFVDFRRVHLIGGSGGNGATAFLHLWCNNEAGPSGGDGGNGGHVILEASQRVKSLADVSGEYRASDGKKGGSKDCDGKSSEHTFIRVPLGTIVKNENDHVVADLHCEEDMFLAARGGAGGKGNHYFMTNENKAPQVSELGAKGENRIYTLEMQTIAHAGLIGFPNAGKSTLLRAISRARPKVAAYPFTTLKPHVGVIQYEDYEQIAVADIPGLIADAHLNRGLGISFLKHIERCLCLIYVIDMSSFEPWNQLLTLNYELEQYQAGLSSRPNLIIANKIDLPKAQQNLEHFRDRANDMKLIPISAKTGFNVSSLLKHLREMYDNEKLNDELQIC